MEDWDSQAKSNGSDDDNFYSKPAKGQERPKKKQVVSSGDEDEIVVKRSTRVRKQVLKTDQIAAVLSDSDEAGDDDDDVEDEEDEYKEDSNSGSESDSQQRSKKIIEENLNCRRSGRERKASKMFTQEMTQTRKRKPNYREDTDDSDDDEDFKRRKTRKTKKKTKPKTVVHERARRKQTGVKSDDEKSGSSDGNSGTSDNASEVDDTIKRYIAQTKGQKGKRKNDGKEESQRETRKGRPKEIVQYADDETSHDSDIDSNDDGDDDEVVEEEDNEDVVGAVLDYRKGKKGATGECTMQFNVREDGDPNLTLETQETEEQYLIKWEGFAHFNNTWESLETLENRPNNRTLKSLRKVTNYIDKVREYNQWKKTASPEDVEYQEIELEMERNLLKTYLDPERIFAEEVNSDENETVYYVKWKNLPYNESTWEQAEVIKKYYPSTLEKYLMRKESKSNPVDYKQIVKTIKKRWQPMKEQPDYIGSETLKLRDYQLEGINFLLHAWHKGNSVILADEMGLGKTIQTIVFLKYLFHNYTFKGPMLVSVPLSTLAAWQKEFETWAPEMNVVAYIGDGQSREIIRQYECEDPETRELIFNVLLTSYEMVGKDREFFVSMSWSNIVIDEAHRLKNQNSLLYKVLLDIDSHHRLLLTGTPLQNSLKELWCLLNYIQIPDLDPWEVFEDNYGSKKDRELGYAKLHKLLKPFIIRRLKKDVEKNLPGKVERILRVDMTVAQKRMYKNVLTRNFDVLCKGRNQVILLNLMMQLRKTCNHSHLILEPEEIAQDDEERRKQLVYGSGKLVLLDKLLARFREKGDRVLIFSQMVTMLNIIEEFLLLRRYQFQRLDGSVGADERKQSIARFNNPESTDFCFLLSTRAGGLGINLQTANVVIIFDSDFNPQNDLQAIARAHRIGQKEEVKIYRLVASNSVDEDIIQKAKNKMVLDHLVIQRMDTTGQSVVGGGRSSGSGKPDGNKLSKEDLNMILKFGAAELFKAEEETEKEREIDLDAILEQAEVREEADDDAHQSEANKELLGAFKCTTITFEETEKEIEEESDVKGLDWGEIIPKELRPEKQTESAEVEVLERKLRRKDMKKESLKDVQMNANNGDDGEEYLVNSEDESSEEGSDSEEETEKPTKKQASKINVKKQESENPMKKQASVKRFKCNKCGKAFAQKQGLLGHMSTQHQESNFILTEENCIKLPKNGTDCQPNLGLKEGRVSCLICFYTFSNNNGLRSHIHQKHLASSSKNDEDQDDLDNLYATEENTALKTSTNVEIKLVVDGEKANNNAKTDSASPPKSKLTEEQMMLIENMLNGMKKYGCSNCEQRFYGKAEMAKHEREHNWKFTCSHCEEKFPSNARLIKHEKEHALGKHVENVLKVIGDNSSIAEKSAIKPQKEKSPKGKSPMKLLKEKTSFLLQKTTSGTKKKLETNTSIAKEKELGKDTSGAKETPTSSKRKSTEMDEPDSETPKRYKRKSPKKSEHDFALSRGKSQEKTKESSSDADISKKENRNDPDVLTELDPLAVTPTTNEDDGIICLDNFAETSDKSKNKLDVHVGLTHGVKSNDVYPNSNILVASNNEKGYDVYKVLQVYTTGTRFKCAKYRHLDQDRWTLTQEVNKHVMKSNIKRIVTLKKDETDENVYIMEEGEPVMMEKKTSADEGEVVAGDDNKENDDMATGNSSKEAITN